MTITRPRPLPAAETGEEIAYAISESSLGAFLVAQSSLGVCAILLGDDRRRRVQELRARFADARLVADDPGLDDAIAAVKGAIEQPRRPLDLPLDIRGTDFQRKVWSVLREIPPGTTTSYAEVARRIGSPKALRAVAGACAANVLALAIPCHRVLRSNGSLSGYRWGNGAQARLAGTREGCLTRSFFRQRERCDNLFRLNFAEFALDQTARTKSPVSKTT